MAQGPRSYIDPNKLFPNSLQFMEDIILQFLQAIFFNFAPDQQPCHYHFDDDTALTEIQIQGQNVDNLPLVDTRPKIVVARGAVQINKSGIGNFVGSKNLSREMQKTATIRQGTVGISCYSRNEIEADRLAEIVADSIESFTPVIRGFGFLEIRASAIGQRAMIKADAIPDLFVTPVLIKVQVTKNYRSQVVDPVRLREIIYQFVVNPVGLKIPPS